MIILKKLESIGKALCYLYISTGLLSIYWLFFHILISEILLSLILQLFIMDKLKIYILGITNFSLSNLYLSLIPKWITGSLHNIEESNLMIYQFLYIECTLYNVNFDEIFDISSIGYWWNTNSFFVLKYNKKPCQ